jgi:drug/metabolite transporter (DMT)-like permease
MLLLKARRLIGMTPMAFPIPQRIARPIAIFAISLFLVFGIAFYREDQYSAGLVFFGGAGILLLGVVVYSTEWFQNLDQSMRIITLIFGVSVVGGFAGLLLHGLEGAVFGCTYSFLGAQLAGAVCALFIRYRDEREEREYETEMRKYGKEP